MTRLVQIVTTTATRDEARAIAQRLVERRLAACVQIEGPVESHYRWQGSVERAEEFRCLIKTRASCYQEVESLVRQWHSYEEPEILAFEVVQGSDGYLRWALEQTGGEFEQTGGDAADV